MILDLSDVPYIDSVGLGSLVAACVSHQKTGRCLVLTGLKPRVRKIMEITKVNEFLRHVWHDVGSGGSAG